MSAKGHSLHKKDYLKLAGMLGVGATGLGAAGIGPLAGLLGGGAAGAGLGAAELGAGAAAGAGSGIAAADYAALGLAPALEAGPGAAAGVGSGLRSADYAALSKPLNWDKAIQTYARMNSLGKMIAPPQQPLSAPQRQQASVSTSTDELERLKRLWGIP